MVSLQCLMNVTVTVTTKHEHPSSGVEWPELMTGMVLENPTHSQKSPPERASAGEWPADFLRKNMPKGFRGFHLVFNKMVRKHHLGKTLFFVFFRFFTILRHRSFRSVTQFWLDGRLMRDLKKLQSDPPQGAVEKVVERMVRDICVILGENSPRGPRGFEAFPRKMHNGPTGLSLSDLFVFEGRKWLQQKVVLLLFTDCLVVERYLHWILYLKLTYSLLGIRIGRKKPSTVQTIS